MLHRSLEICFDPREQPMLRHTVEPVHENRAGKGQEQGYGHGDDSNAQKLPEADLDFVSAKSEQPEDCGE